MLWTAYLNGGAIPFGQQFIRTVEELAQRAGVDPSPITNTAPRDRRTELLETFFDACKRELVSDRGSDGTQLPRRTRHATGRNRDCRNWASSLRR